MPCQITLTPQYSQAGARAWIAHSKLSKVCESPPDTVTENALGFFSTCTNLPTLTVVLIRNPVVEYTYAKEDRVVASCDYGRVGAPLQESEGPRRTLSSSDRMAAERGK